MLHPDFHFLHIFLDLAASAAQAIDHVPWHLYTYANWFPNVLNRVLPTQRISVPPAMAY